MQSLQGCAVQQQRQLMTAGTSLPTVGDGKKGTSQPAKTLLPAAAAAAAAAQAEPGPVHNSATLPFELSAASGPANCQSVDPSQAAAASQRSTWDHQQGQQPQQQQQQQAVATAEGEPEEVVEAVDMSQLPRATAIDLQTTSGMQSAAEATAGPVAAAYCLIHDEAETGPAAAAAAAAAAPDGEPAVNQMSGRSEASQSVQQPSDAITVDEGEQDNELQEQGAMKGAAAAASGEPQKQKKPPKPQPTHFLALQVSQSPKVVATISTIQQKLVEVEPQLHSCCLQPVTAHITIMVLNLASQAHIDAADVALSELGSVLVAKGVSAPIQLQLQGVSHFKHQVLYLDVAPGAARDALMDLGATVIDHLSAAAGSSLIVPGDDKPFVPHVTVAKTSRLTGRYRRGGRRPAVKIPEAAWQGFLDVDAGHVTIDELQICSMQGRKPGQYYKVTHKLKLVQPPAEVQPPVTAPAAVAVKAPGPLAAARKRFRRLLSAVACGGLKRHKADGQGNQ